MWSGCTRSRASAALTAIRSTLVPTPSSVIKTGGNVLNSRALVSRTTAMRTRTRATTWTTTTLTISKRTTDCYVAISRCCASLTYYYLRVWQCCSLCCRIDIVLFAVYSHLNTGCTCFRCTPDNRIVLVSSCITYASCSRPHRTIDSSSPLSRPYPRFEECHRTTPERKSYHPTQYHV